MAGETVITIIGNLTADPEIRTTGSGASVASFTIASTPRTWNRNTNQFEDGQALFMRCSAWRDLATHCAQSLAKGMRVIAQGRLQQRSYQAQDGSNRTGRRKGLRISRQTQQGEIMMKHDEHVTMCSLEWLEHERRKAWQEGYAAGWKDQECDFPPHTTENPYLEAE